MEKILDIENLSIAIYFETVMDERLSFPVFVATRPLLGIVNEDTSLFTEYFSGETYLNTDISYAAGMPDGYNFSFTIKEIKEKYPDMSLQEAYSKMWEEMEQLIYYYDEETGILCMSDTESFENEFNIKLNLVHTKQINEMNTRLLNGDVAAAKEYLEGEAIEEAKPFEVKMDRPINELIDDIKKKIISQDEAVKRLTIAAYKNLYFDTPEMKSNILLYGPTGVGKTALVRALGEVFDFPIWIEDMTRYTEAGYKGADIDDILINMYYNAECDIERAQRTILFLDEIDKKASNDEEKAVNKSGVLKSLLKTIEGGRFEIEVSRGRFITFDTSHLTIIAGGAFTDLYKNKEKTKIDFTSTNEIVSKKELTIKDFEKYGMPIEFLGRFKTIIKMNELNLEDFIKILKTSDLSALKNYKNAFEKKGIQLELPESIYEKIAKLAMQDATGARSLNKIVDNIFENVLYEFFSSENINSISLGEDITSNKNDFKLTRKLGN